MGMVIPNVILVYLLSAIVPLSLHIGVSRYLLFISGVVALFWFQLEYLVTEKFRRPTLAIVPTGQALDLLPLAAIDGRPIGRASCRERVWQYVYISVVARSLKQKQSK